MRASFKRSRLISTSNRLLARSNLDTVPRIRPKRWHIIINNDKCIPCGSTKTKYKIGVFVDFVSLYRTLWGTNQKIKIHFFVFSTLSGPSETKKTWKFVWQIGETKLRQISPKKKNSNFVFCTLSPTRNGLINGIFHGSWNVNLSHMRLALLKHHNLQVVQN